MDQTASLPAASAVAPAPNAPVEKRNLRILYADDVPELRNLLRISLPRDGHTVETVEDGTFALEKLRTQPDAFDLLITDHHMPKMTGLELIEHVRGLPFHGKIIVFCSELSRDVNEAYQQFKVDHILYKPIFPAELRKVLAKL
jgi:two-component system chemotaxis response regulator CheY